MQRRSVRVGIGLSASALVGVLTNVATAGFDLAPYRWALLAGLGVLNVGYIAFEIVMSRREGTVGGTDDTISPAPPHPPAALAAEAVEALPARPVSRPWMQPSFDREVVDRPAITAELRRLLLDGTGGTVGVTTALFGAGGFGRPQPPRSPALSRRSRRPSPAACSGSPSART